MMIDDIKAAIYCESISHIGLKPLYESIESTDDISIILEEINREEFSEFIDDLVKNNKGIFARVLGKNPEPLNKNEIMSDWNSRGKPTDEKEILNMLKSHGANNNAIKRTIKKFNKDDLDSNLLNLSKNIKKVGIQIPILKYLKHKLNIKESIDEAVISSDDIKKVISRISSAMSQLSDKKGDNTYLRDWKDNFNISNKVEKLRLSKEFINYVYDRKNDPRFDAYVSFGVSSIKSSDLPDSVKPQLIKMLRNGEPFSRIKASKKDFIEQPKKQQNHNSERLRDKQNNISSEDIDKFKNYIRSWSSSFNTANLTGKVKLGKEAINYASDRKSDKGHDFLVSTFSKIIRDSYLPNNIKRSYLNALRDGKYYNIKVESSTIDGFINMINECAGIDRYGRIKRGNNV